jgi:hypothetical protein
MISLRAKHLHVLPPRTQARRFILLLLGGVGFLCFAALCGAAIAFIGPLAAVGVTAMMGGIVGFFIPLRYLYALTLISAFLIMGQLIYFARIDKALWLPFLLGLTLLVRFPADLMRRKLSSPWQAPFRPQTPTLLRVLIIVYFLTLVASTLINRNNFLQIFISSKEYLFLWSVFFIISSGLISPQQLRKTWQLFPWLLVLQFPLVLYQRFVIVPQRATQRLGAEWDAVVGAFGGDPNGGGASGAMGIFTVFAMVTAYLLWKNGTMKKKHAWLLLTLGISTLLLSEVKFAVLLLPIAFGIALFKELKARPIAAGIAIVFTTIVTGAVLLAYEAQYAGDIPNNGEQKTYFEQLSSSTTDGNFINFRTGEMGRGAAIQFWVTQQNDLVGALIGNGIGASRKGDLATGTVAKRWPFNIARSSLAILLWEVGLLGTFAFLALLATSFFTLQKLAAHAQTPPEDKPFLLAASAGVGMLGLAMPYNTDLIYSPQIQILLMLFLGQIALTGGRLRALAGVRR